MEQEESPRLFNLTPGFQVWLLIILNFAAGGIIQLLSGVEALQWLNAGPDSGHSVLTGRMAIAFYSCMAFLLPILVFANAIPAERFYWLKLHQKTSLKNYLIGAVVMILGVFSVDVVYNLIKAQVTMPELLEYEKLTAAYSDWLLLMPDAGNLFTALLFNALVPAVTEELFFRGGVQQASAGWLRNGHAAVWFTAIVFSFIHFDIIGFPARVLMGATLGYLFYFTGSLQVSVLAHFCFNAFTIIVSYLEQQNPSGFWASFNVPTVVGFVALGIIIVLLYVLFRNRKKIASL